jgi:hypothetical protein
MDSINMTNSSDLVSESCHESTFKLIRHHNFNDVLFSVEATWTFNKYNNIENNEHKSYAWVFGVICTFQSSQFFDRLSHFGVVDHIRTSALTTADRRPPSCLVLSWMSKLPRLKIKHH